MRTSTLVLLLVACAQRTPDPRPMPMPAPVPMPTALDSTPIVTECGAAPDGGIREQLAVPWVTMNGQQLLIDVAGPVTPGPHPMVLAIHGGGWSKGDRSDFLPLIRSLASRGYVAATVQYRLATSAANVFPAAVQDVRCAVRFLRANAASTGGDPSRFAVIGASAGGHLASMLGTAPEVSGLDGTCPFANQPVNVSAVIVLSGPTDLRDLSGFGTGAVEQEDLPAIVSNFLGGAPSAVPATARLASPITHVTAKAPPFFLSHGTADDMVLVSQSRAMREVLRDAGVKATLFEAEGAGHGSGYTTAQSQTIACTMAAFLDATLAP